MQRETFRIRQFTNPSGGIAFRVSGMIDDKRIRKNFRTKEEALAGKQQFEIELLNLEPATRLKSTRLSDPQLLEAEKAFTDLGDKSLSAAVRFYLENAQEGIKPIRIDKAYRQFLSDKTSENLRSESIRNLKSRVGFLAKAYPKKKVHEVQQHHIEEIINQPGRGLITRNNCRLALSGFFSWAIENRHCLQSPMRFIKAAKVDQAEAEIFSNTQVESLLVSASSFKSGVLLPYLAIGIFAAGRPNEIGELSWKDIDLDEQTIRISSIVAKKRQRRITEISDNLLAWLVPHALSRTPIKGRNFRRNFKAVRIAAGVLDDWVPDIMRHTGISHRLALVQDESKVANWAGNSPDTVHKDYKGLVTRKQCERFWNITPDTVQNKIIRMKA
ncbi:MAG TPA: hypothetical protein EYQ50_22880 [Verrucomicrobiales bacterium]|nr:hypothetical protein [Verrucomicrobiales bacterium]